LHVCSNWPATTRDRFSEAHHAQHVKTEDRCNTRRQWRHVGGGRYSGTYRAIRGNLQKQQFYPCQPQRLKAVNTCDRSRKRELLVVLRVLCHGKQFRERCVVYGYRNLQSGWFCKQPLYTSMDGRKSTCHICSCKPDAIFPQYVVRM
jgi:hypothetical protein